ncbi:MAG: protealysin inhibitor emfourin [Planctomycetota bacterium]
MEIERLGGLAGFGLPSSRIRSHITLSYNDLNDKEIKNIDALFLLSPDRFKTMNKVADFFRYRIEVKSSGTTKTIEVSENDLIASIKDRIKDVLM